MFFSTKKNEALKETAFIEGREAYIKSFQRWHKLYAEKQVELEASFDATAITKYSINVWDDYPVEVGTYAYIEMNEVPDNVCIEVLLHLLDYAKSNQKITDMGLILGLRFRDSSVVYPTLIGRRDGEFSLFKRWEITIAGADYEKLESFVKQLKGVPAYAGIPLDIYSES